MTKKSGYYVADVAGCADPSIVLYFDGEKMFTHGAEKPVNADYLLFIGEAPFDHRKVGQDIALQDASDWFVEASKGVTKGVVPVAPQKSVYEVVLMVDGKKEETYVEAHLKSDVFDLVSASPKDVSVVSVRPVASSLASILGVAHESD